MFDVDRLPSFLDTMEPGLPLAMILTSIDVRSLTGHDRIVVYATDVSHPQDSLDPRVVDLARDANLLIHDAQFTPEERQERPGWGHSSWLEAVQVAREARVQHLALFHHDPIRGDAELDEIERQAQALFPSAFLAREEMEIRL